MKPQDLSFLRNVSPIDWARLAAYIDGEGCISIASVRGNSLKSRRVYYANVAITNTDPRLIEWLKNTFGGTVYMQKRQTERHSDKFTWNAASRHAAVIVGYCLQYFIIKREQAETLLSFQRTILPGRPYGVKGRPQDLIDQQHAFKDQLSDLKGTSSYRRFASKSV
jgi:LAGLIDADG endonuclease